MNIQVSCRIDMAMSRTFACIGFVLGFLMLKYGADAVFYDKVTVHIRGPGGHAASSKTD